MVDRGLQNIGTNGWRARRKPLLTKFQGMCQLVWAKEHRTWTVEQWQRVIFSEENHFCLYGNRASQYVRQFLHEELHPKCLSATLKHPPKFVVCGGMPANWCWTASSIRGRNGEHCKIPQNRNASLGKKSLQNEISSFKVTMWAKVIQNWSVSHDIMLLQWPRQSPEFNSI